MYILFIHSSFDEHLTFCFIVDYFLFLFKMILFIYFKENKQNGEAAGEGEADSPLSREADTGLNSKTLGL